jgi:hypothetical protein
MARSFRFVTQTSVTSKASPDAVFDVISDLGAHVEWSGERAADPKFKLLNLEASDPSAVVGTTFASTGSNFNGTFYDRSVVTESVRPSRLTIETDSRLDRTRGRTWEVRFEHRYDVLPEGEGSRITYTETIHRANYVPYWLKPVVRSIFRPLVTARTGSSYRTSPDWLRNDQGPSAHDGGLDREPWRRDQEQQVNSTSTISTRSIPGSWTLGRGSQRRPLAGERLGRGIRCSSVSHP